jgi:diguanylate cyclase (GGDEF)-like protein/PAS domain S-box-containing protein
LRLRNWLAVVISVLLLVAVGIVGVVVNRSALRAADTVHRSDTLALAVNNATLAGQMRQLSAKELKTFADSHAFNLGTGYPGDRAALEAFVAKSASFPYGAALTGLDGTVLNSSLTNPLPLSDDPGYQPMRRLLLAGQLGVSGVMRVKDAGGAVVAVEAFAVPITVGGVTTAVLLGYHKLAATTLQAYIARLQSGAHLTSIVDTTGRIGFAGDGSRIGTLVDAPVAAAVARLGDGGSAFVEYRSGDTPMISIVVKDPSLPGGWAYVRTQTMASFDGAVHSRSQTINLTLLAMLLIGAIGLSILGYRTQVQRRRADERFQALFLHAPDMVAVVDAEGRVAYSSPSAASVLHFPAGSLQGTSVFELVHPDDRPAIVQAFGTLLTERDGVLRMQTRILNQAGAASWFEFTASNQMHNPALTGIVINARDISENRAFQERLHHEATHDALTGLPNRRRMQDALGSSLRDDPVAVLFVDLDGFKPVNDAHGHAAGDELLRQVAERLSSCVRDGDVLARVGGDEFVVLMPGVTVPADADTMSSRVRAEVQRPFQVYGTEILIGASVGVHLATPSDDPDQALRAADHAMYMVKHLGGGRRADAAEPAPATAGRHRADESRHRADEKRHRADEKGSAPISAVIADAPLVRVD